MQLKLKLDADKIYHKEFDGSKPGYNSLQVDAFLDGVIQDYETIDSFVLSAEQKIEELTRTNKLMKERLTTMEAENAILNEKLKNITDNDNASLSNLDLLNRISALEAALYKAGVNPTNIK